MLVFINLFFKGLMVRKVDGLWSFVNGHLINAFVGQVQLDKIYVVAEAGLVKSLEHIYNDSTIYVDDVCIFCVCAQYPLCGQIMMRCWLNIVVITRVLYHSCSICCALCWAAFCFWPSMENGDFDFNDTFELHARRTVFTNRLIAGYPKKKTIQCQENLV